MNSLSTINPDEIISILKEEIENYDEISKDKEVGTVVSVRKTELLRSTASTMQLTVRS